MAKCIVEMTDWVDVSAFNIRENYYQVSRYGEIRVKATGKILKQFPERSNRYLRIALILTTGKVKKFMVHRIVAAHFCKKRNMNKYNQVNHIDGDGKNNAWYNLEWVSGPENMDHAYRTGLATTIGEQCHFCVYTDEQVHEMCRLLEKGLHPKEIMKEMNLLDVSVYHYGSKEYDRIRSYIKKLRTKSFRKEITHKYKI